MVTVEHVDLTAQDMAFRFLAGRVCIAFTATVGERWNRCFERLVEPKDLSRWLQEAGVSDRRIPISQAQLADARLLREAIYRCAKALTASEELKQRDVALINKWAMEAAPAPQLRGGRIIKWKAAEPVSAALSVIARDAIDLFGGKWGGRIRECASETCALLFVDLSRPGKRRWCSSETCGSQSRSAAYRSRH
jgi:predicted RNA-binding Zn ribbon-like protein